MKSKNTSKKNKTKPLLILAGVVCVILLASVITRVNLIDEKKDDWILNVKGDSLGSKITNTVKSIAGGIGGLRSQSAMMESTSSDSIGYSVGGAKDVENFRENIKNGYLPLKTDITYEGLFYDYYFNTNPQQECQELFCPYYTKAVSNDPFSNETEYFLSVGLNSNLEKADFERKKLNLIVVLDISGSMSSPFNRYYYDRYKSPYSFEEQSEEETKSKMQVANEAIVGLLDHLNEDDRFGMVVFESRAYVAKPLSKVGETDMEKIKEHILDLEAMGGTNMEAGFKKGTELFSEVKDADKDEYENRIIFLTDAMPNTGRYGEESLLGMTEANADEGIYTTFIGIGVDFNTRLIESISDIKGCNYYSVHSTKEFMKRMDEQFEYMVTPLVFDLELTLESQGYDIEKVFGSPSAEEATGEIMTVKTLFPSPTTEEGTKGGIILLKLKKVGEDEEITLSVDYKDRQGESHSSQEVFEFKPSEEEQYDNKAIRKGILLSRYAGLMKTWIEDAREGKSDRPEFPIFAYREEGIPIHDDEEEIPIQYRQFSEWERTSLDLAVPDEYKELFEDFKDYFEREAEAIGDATLDQEIDIFNILLEV